MSDRKLVMDLNSSIPSLESRKPPSDTELEDEIKSASVEITDTNAENEIEAPKKNTPIYKEFPFWVVVTLFVSFLIGLGLNFGVPDGVILSPWFNFIFGIVFSASLSIFTAAHPKTKTIMQRKLAVYGGLLSLIAWVNLGINDIIRSTVFGLIMTAPSEPVISPARHYWMAVQTLMFFPLIFLVITLKLFRSSSTWSVWESGFIILQKRLFERRMGELKRDMTQAFNPDALEGVSDVVIAYNFQTGKPVWLKPKDRTMHLLVTGPSGSGKTQGVLNPLVQQDLKNPQTGVSVIEPKGDWVGKDWDEVPPGNLPGVLAMAQLYGRKIYLLDPNREDTDVFNPFVGDIETVAEINAVALKSLFGQQDAFFSIVQNTVTKNFIKLLKHIKGDNANFLHLKQMLLDEHQLREMINELAEKIGVAYVEATTDDNGRVINPGYIKGRYDETDNRITLLQWFISEYFGPAGSKVREFALGLRMQLDSLFSNTYFLRCVIPRPDSRVINLDQHLRENSVLCVSTNDGVLGGDLSKVLGILVSQHLQAAVSRRDPQAKNPFHALYMDEFATYVNEAFSGFIEKARGFNVGLVLGFQGLDQLIKVGEGNVGTSFRDTVITQCGTKVFYGRLGPNDVEYIQRMFGISYVEEEVEQEGRNNQTAGIMPNTASYGIRRQKVERATMSFNDIRYQEANFVVYERMIDRSIEPPAKGFVEAVNPKKLPTRPPAGVNPIEYRSKKHMQLQKEEQKSRVLTLTLGQDPAFTLPGDSDDELSSNVLRNPMDDMEDTENPLDDFFEDDLPDTLPETPEISPDVTAIPEGFDYGGDDEEFVIPKEPQPKVIEEPEPKKQQRKTSSSRSKRKGQTESNEAQTTIFDGFE